MGGGPNGRHGAERGTGAAGGECIRYGDPGTGHAFVNDDRPEAYHREAAGLAWAPTLDLLRQRLT